MKKMNGFIIAGIVVVIAGILLITFGIMKKKSSGQIMDGPGMVYEAAIKSISYTYGGSSIGDSYCIYFTNGKITVSSCEGNGCKTKTQTAYIGADAYSEVDRIAEEYNMKTWKDLPKEDFFALDAATTSFSIDFADGTGIHVGTYDILPENGWEGVLKIKEILENAIK